MKLYLASLNLYVLEKYISLFPNKKLNVLRTFALLNDENSAFIRDHKDYIGSLVLDSGTWSLNNSKYPPPHMTRENYIQYVSQFIDEFDFYISYDSAFDENEYMTNIQNLMEMEKRGLKPVPVIHNIAEEIDFYIDRGYRRVALGSSQITDSETMESVMNRFKGTGIKIHLFGKSGFKFMANFPIDSCDTAKWAHSGAFGHILYWNPHKPGIDKTDKIYCEEYTPTADEKENKITLSNYEFRDDLEKHLAILGYSFDDILGPEGSYVKMVINTFYYLRLEEEINRIHREKGFNTN
jgi:hypothetical protein